MTFEEYWKQYWTPSAMPGVFDEAMKDIARKSWTAAIASVSESVKSQRNDIPATGEEFSAAIRSEYIPD